MITSRTAVPPQETDTASSGPYRAPPPPARAGRVAVRRRWRGLQDPGRRLKESQTPAQALRLARRGHEAFVRQAARPTVAAVIAYLVAQRLSTSPQPLLAPLTALLVVQFTLYATLTSGLRRVTSVVVGVLVAVGFGHWVGFSWWSLGVLIFAALLLGRFLHLGPEVQEVAISGMLVMGVGNPAATAQGRAVETLIGAAVGVTLNLVLAPPVYVQPAGEAVDNLSDQLSELLRRMGRDIRQGAGAESAGSWLAESRRLDQELVGVDAALVKAEDSLRLNPRGRQLLHTRLILRSRMDTLEHSAVAVRSLCRALLELSCGPDRGAFLYAGELAVQSEELLGRLADAIDAFGGIVTAEVAPHAETHRENLAHALDQARARRDEVARFLRSQAGRDPHGWELEGALLASVDRLVEELQVASRPPAQGRRADRGVRTWAGRILRLLARRGAAAARALAGRLPPRRARTGGSRGGAGRTSAGGT